MKVMTPVWHYMPSYFSVFQERQVDIHKPIVYAKGTRLRKVSRSYIRVWQEEWENQYFHCGDPETTSPIVTSLFPYS